MPRFVLLFHECPPGFGKPSHWDLMLERDGALTTWSFFELPSAWRDEGASVSPREELVRATKLADHRLDYLEYEGPLSGDRGSVSRCDSGEYRLVEEKPGCLSVELRGKRVAGRTALRQVVGEGWVLELVE
jgi:hypothetical protein